MATGALSRKGKNCINLIYDSGFPLFPPRLHLPPTTTTTNSSMASTSDCWPAWAQLCASVRLARLTDDASYAGGHNCHECVVNLYVLHSVVVVVQFLSGHLSSLGGEGGDGGDGSSSPRIMTTTCFEQNGLRWRFRVQHVHDCRT